DGFPVHVSFLHIDNYPLHFHLDVEMMYVLRGNIQLKNGNSLYTLKEGDIFISNKQEVHGLYDGSEDNLIAVIHLESSAMAETFPKISEKGGSCFRTLAEDRGSSKYTYLNRQLIYCMYLVIQKHVGYKETIVQEMRGLLEFLDKHFNYWIYDSDDIIYWEERKDIDQERLRDIISYVYAHRGEKITLNDLSYEMSLDSYHLSHLITNTLGITFRDLVNYARIEMADQLLLAADMSISEISKMVKISTVDYFNKHFQKWFKCTPESYREKYQPHTIIRSDNLQIAYADERTALDLIEAIAAKEAFALPVNKEMSNALDIDVNMFSNWNHSYQSKILVGDQYLTLKEIDEMRFAGALPEKAGETEGDEKANYYWDSVLAPIYIIWQHILVTEKQQRLSNNCMDSRSDGRILQGKKGIFTEQGIAKPLYYAYYLLESITGKVVYSSGMSYVVHSKKDERLLFLFNNTGVDYSDNLSRESAGIDEVFKELNSYTERKDINLRVSNIKKGRYLMREFTLCHSNSLLSHLYNEGTADKVPDAAGLDWAERYAAPVTKSSVIDIDGRFTHQIRMEGVTLTAIELKKL
ncbi:MAG: AraC family transcriptional regulator, partial [Bacillota bacterium]|nr:AraC family transcriptional regulator [Bacillota bacterium]